MLELLLIILIVVLLVALYNWTVNLGKPINPKHKKNNQRR